MANRKRIEVDIIANDKASHVFNQVRTTSSSMSSTLMTKLGGTVNAVGNMNRVLRDYNNAMYGFNRIMINGARIAARSIYDFTRDAINNFSELERQHAKTMGAMATEYGKTTEAQAKFLKDSEKLKQQALQFGTYGPDGKGSLNQVIDVSYAQTALVKSGMSADDLLNTDAIESILKFAGGNDLSIDTATQFAVNLGTVFNKPVEEWGKMLDMVTKAADISVIDVPDIMDSLTYTGGIASGLNRDLEEVLGIISVMGQAGLRGRVAGTGLQAFFTRILSAGELSDKQIDNAPSEYVGNMYNAFISEATNADGSFKEMDKVAETLDTAMESLNDKEQAWFAKKLFGLYQMKAAYALTGSVDGDTNLITDFINQIANQSTGTNDIKYDLMLGSQYGKIESLKNVWEGTKTDIGDKLSPVVSTISDELFSFLSNDGNYEINWDKLRQAFTESGDLIGEKYGEELGKAVEGLGNLGIDSGMIIKALFPEVGGIGSGFIKLMNGDISGALSDFKEGLDETNGNIDDLPPELQETAKGFRNLIIALTALSGLNIVTKISEWLTSIGKLVLKPISWATGKITSGSTSVSSTSASMSVGTANAITINSAQLMNVTASVVNVYGGNNLGNPTNPGSPTTTPMLPGGSPTPLLPGGGMVLLPPSSLKPALPSGSPKLPSGSPTSVPIDTSNATRLFKIGGTYMTGAQIAKMILTKSAMVAAAGATMVATSSPGLYSSNDKRVQQGSDWIDRYVSEGNTNYGDIAQNARVYDWAKSQPGYKSGNETNIVKVEISGRSAAREEMMSLYKTEAGAEYLKGLFEQQITEQGKITEDFLSSLMTWTKDNYTYTGTNEDINEILGYMYKNFTPIGGAYAGRFADTGIDKFVKNNDNLYNFSTSSVKAIESVSDSAISKINSLNLQSPILNVNVTTNVDKSGNATSVVKTNTSTKGNFYDDYVRRSARYGITAMDR